MFYKKFASKFVPSLKEDTLKKELIIYKDPKIINVPIMGFGFFEGEVLVNVDDYVKKGQIVGKTKGIDYAIIAPVSGKVIEITKKVHRGGKPIISVVIENDCQETLHDYYLNLPNFNELNFEQRIEVLQRNGLIGMGGVGFPTFVKFEQKGSVDKLVINASECEPFLNSDYHLMRYEMDHVLYGVQVAIDILEVKDAFFVIKAGNNELKKFINARIKELGMENIHLFEISDVYASSWEKYMAFKLFGLIYDRLPLEIGIIFENVATIKALYNIFIEKIPATERYVTVAGPGIVEPSIILTKSGVMASELILAAKSYVSGVEEVYLVSGGPMMGKTIHTDQFVIDMAAAAVLVFPLTMIDEDSSYYYGKLEEEPCIQCSRCVDTCPVLLEPVLIMDAFKLKNTNVIEKLNASACINCGICTFVCPSNIQVADFVQKALAKLK